MNREVKGRSSFLDNRSDLISETKHMMNVDSGDLKKLQYANKL